MKRGKPNTDINTDIQQYQQQITENVQQPSKQATSETDIPQQDTVDSTPEPEQTTSKTGIKDHASPIKLQRTEITSIATPSKETTSQTLTIGAFNKKNDQLPKIGTIVQVTVRNQQYIRKMLHN